MQPMRASGGFSLIEVMVSAAILLIVTVYIMQAFTVQLRNYLVVDQVMSTQQNLRVVADLVERDVRRAGFMVPPRWGWAVVTALSIRRLTTPRRCRSAMVLICLAQYPRSYCPATSITTAWSTSPWAPKLLTAWPEGSQFY